MDQHSPEEAWVKEGPGLLNTMGRPIHSEEIEQTRAHAEGETNGAAEEVRGAPRFPHGP